MLPEEVNTNGCGVAIRRDRVRAMTQEGKQNEEDAMKILQEWLQKQMYLPREIDDLLLQQMLCRCSYGIEKTKARLEAYFNLRTFISEVFADRNPFSQESKTAYHTMLWSSLPRTTPQGNVVYVCRLRDQDASKFSFHSILRTAHMEMDELTRNSNGKEEVSRPVAGFIYVFDLTGFTMAHIGRMPLTLLSQMFSYIHEGMPIKSREVHLLSPSSVVDKLMTFLRPLVRRMDKLHIHSTNNLSTLFEHIPKDIFPEEYGGKEPSLEELHDRRRAAVEKFSSWLSEEEKNHRVSEESLARWRKGISWSLALGQGNGNAAFGVDGSFRKLCLD